VAGRQCATAGLTLAGARDGETPLHVILNMSDTARAFALPRLAGYAWRRALDTALASPLDITPPEQQTATLGEHYDAQARQRGRYGGARVNPQPEPVSACVRPVVLWNIIGVATNLVSVAAYYFRKTRKRIMNDLFS